MINRFKSYYDRRPDIQAMVEEEGIAEAKQFLEYLPTFANGKSIVVTNIRWSNELERLFSEHGMDFEMSIGYDVKHYEPTGNKFDVLYRIDSASLQLLKLMLSDAKYYSSTRASDNYMNDGYYTLTILHEAE